MSRAVGPGFVVFALVASAAAAPRTKGKVVRVERQRSSSVLPRICDVQHDRTGNCFGEEPRIGDIITLVDEGGITGEVRITEAAAFALAGRSSQGCDGLWSVKTELLRGDLSNAGTRTMGVIDPGMHPRNSRMIPKEQLQPPNGHADDVPAVGFDRDGDHVADIILLQSNCDGSGSMCIEEWFRVEGRMVRVHQVNFQTCGF